jgi:5'-nucleotidase
MADTEQPPTERLNGQPLDPAGSYRVVINNFLASGGDGLAAFTGGTEVVDSGIIDLDALVAWIAPGRSPPASDRIRLIAPK